MNCGKYMKKFFLIVLYKCKVSESKTCESLDKINILSNVDNCLCIWDNSPDEINSYAECVSFFKSKNIE